MDQPTLFPTAPDEVLLAVYQRQGRTLDDLPYTESFERIAQAMGADEADDPRAARAGLLHRLHNLRKAGRLPRLGRAGSPAVRVGPDHEQLLAGLIEEAVGRLSRRDQLPYTPAFDRVVAAFNARAGLALSPHDVWRLAAKLAK